jgi:PAS domain-containing protein
MTDKTPSARGDSPSLAQAAEHLHLLVETGLLLAYERSVDIIVQASLDTGLKLSGAAFGAFFYNCFSADGTHCQLYKVSGVDPAAFSQFPLPRPTAVFAESLVHARILRSGDITQDPRFGQNAPRPGMPPGHLPVRSFLSVPVVSRSGEILGGIVYGHLEPEVFTAESESLVATIAAQAAVAMDNARLTENLTSEIAIADAARQLQRETSERLEQAFEAMAESARRLRQALDAGALGTWSWDMATDRLDLDERAAELLFAESHTPIRRAELRRRIVHTDDLPNTPDDLGQAVLNGGTYSAEYRAEGPGKTQRWIAARGLATFNDAHKLIGMTGTVQDITDRKTQEASLRQSEKLAATGRLAATIAHEINNPLEAVTNLIYLCKTDTTVPPPARDRRR